MIRFPTALEDAYQADLAGEKIRMAHTAAMLCVLLYLGSALFDEGTMPGHAAGDTMLTVIAELLHLADQRMYESKRERKQVAVS